MTSNPFSTGSKLSKMAAVYNGWRRRDVLMPLNMVYEALSVEFGVSVSSVKRYIKHIKSNGCQPKAKKPRPPVAWDAEALEFFKVLYLKANREAGRYTVRDAYRRTVLKAKQEGWKIGSEQSAYVHARDIHTTLRLYAKGGSRALDNMFYIARDLSGLRPFQVIVGDQHRFDFWVADGDGVYFRPECYLWLDMRTRLPYGIAFDRHYTTRTVLRALKMGVGKFGKFESTYNDNGAGEKSAVADYTIEQLQNYGMSFRDEGDLYRTEAGEYVVEGIDGDDSKMMVNVVKSRAEWKKQNRRIFANVKNAKAKPIERFFSTLEQILRDMILPGLVIDTTDDAATEEESSRRLEWQKQNGFILTFRDFACRVDEAINTYAHRVHGTLRRSPLDELEHAIKVEGWRHTFIEKEDIKYLFLERAYATVRGDRVTLAGRQFIGPTLTQNMLRANRGNLAGLNRKKVELRYDPDDLDAGVWAIDPRNDQAISLTPVTPIPMLDNDAAGAALGWKRRNMKAVRETYNSMTANALTLFDPERFRELNESRAVASAGELPVPLPLAPPVQQQPLFSSEEFKVLVSKKITLEPITRTRAKPVYLSPRHRYEALLAARTANVKISADDIAFMAEFESTMTEQQQEYFASQIRINQKH
jgi:putative transposase